ncbi:MAG: patatin-like phospholipase family protein [Myxococcota bacterium]
MFPLIALTVLSAPLNVQQKDSGYFAPAGLDKQTDELDEGTSEATPGPLPLTLTIRGGISLGAYEAGYNWALLRLMRRSGAESGRRLKVELKALSGASAGNINVFLGAIDWLESTPTELEGPTNLLWKAWINVGLQQLLPPVDDCKGYQKILGAYDPLGNGVTTATEDGDKCQTYGPDDGVLSRRAFERIYGHLHERLGNGGFRDAPEIPLGVSMTLTQPQPKAVGSLAIETQRAYTAFTAVVSNGHLDFKSRELEAPKSLGHHVYLEPHANDSLNAAVSDIATASSAFPVAFGPKALCVYLYPPRLRGKDGVPTTCTSLRFLDGGVFDNAPVRLAQTLGKGHRLSLDLDPDLPAAPGASKAAPAPGLAETFGILGGAVTTARRAEMLNLANNDRVLPMRRSVRVYGERLGAFAAFIARAYRRYDYYVGVFDAARFFAIDRCYALRSRLWERPDLKSLPPPAEADTCYFETLASLYGELAVGGSPDAAYIFGELVRTDAATTHVPDAAERWQFSSGEPSVVIKSVAKAMLLGPVPEARGTDLASVALQREGTLGLLQRLEEDDDLSKERARCRHARDDTTCIEVRELDTIFEDTNGWVASQARAALSRMYDVEHATAGAGETVADFAQFAFEQDAMPRRTGFQLEWTVPRWSKHRYYLWLLPTVVDLHLKDGGGALRYMPALALTSHWVLVAPLTPLWWQRDTQKENAWRAMGSVGIGAQYRTGSLGLSAIELAGHFIVDTYNRGNREEWAQRLSGELGFYWAAGKVHTALQCGDGPAFRDEGLLLGRNCLFKLGLADLPGLAYWAARLGD